MTDTVITIKVTLTDHDLLREGLKQVKCELHSAVHKVLEGYSVDITDWDVETELEIGTL